jgi:phosphoserine phosphatase
MTMSLIRPDIRAGPMFRNSSPERISDVIRLVLTDLGPGLTSSAQTAKETIKMARRAGIKVFFISSSFEWRLRTPERDFYVRRVINSTSI